MPRVFLFTNRRYKTHLENVVDVENTEFFDGSVSPPRVLMTSSPIEEERSCSVHGEMIPSPVPSPQSSDYDMECDSRKFLPFVLPLSDSSSDHSLSPCSLKDCGLSSTWAQAINDTNDLKAFTKLDHNLNVLVDAAWNEINVEEDHICPECGKRYSTSSNLARHRQTHRSVSDKKARKCPHCDKVYVSMPAYSMHVRTHNQGCECQYCGKRFSRPWLLQGHIRTHTGEKPFNCPTCNKAFADKSNLRAHIQTHSTDKPFVCGRCGKAFALKSYLYKHEESSCMRGQRYNRH